MAKSKAQRLALAFLIVGCFCLVALIVARHELSACLIRVLRDRSIRIVKERFDADVQFGRFDITLLYPRLVITGGNVALTKRGRAGLPTLIFLKNFTVESDLRQFLKTPTHIRRVQLQGMVIHIPPRGEKNPQPSQPVKQHYPVIIDQFQSDNAVLNILPKRGDKPPLQFLIHRLTMQNAGLGRSAPYQATLTNPLPHGEIQATGHFGPWQPQEPSLTPLSGSYSFLHADLASFPGISGTLDSTGRFDGVLDHIVADGETSTPDFALDVSDHPVSLNTQFHAIIDGTNGDTALKPVKAQFLHSSLVANGAIFGTSGRKGKTILLDVTVHPARLEDMLRLGVKARPAMIGDVRFHTQLAISPGERSVTDRLKLDGRFLASSVEPTNPDLQEKLRKLSSRAQGQPKRDGAGSDVFDLKGVFVLDNATARFPALQFTIPGAHLNLSGQYGLRTENLNFFGELRMKAKLSQTTTGVKSFVLKAVDPFFKGKHDGAVLPIKIAGTRAKPSFGLAFHQPHNPKPPQQYSVRRLP